MKLSRYMQLALLLATTPVCASAQTAPSLARGEHKHDSDRRAFVPVNVAPALYVATQAPPSHTPDLTSMVYAIGDDTHAPVPVNHPVAPQLDSDPACSSPPMRSQLRPFSVSERLSPPQARALGLNLPSPQLEEGPFTLLVWRTGAAAECLGRDGHTTVLYGSEFDLAVLLPEDLARRMKDFSSLLDDSALRNRISHVAYRISGFSNPTPLRQAIALLQSTVSESSMTQGRTAELRERLYALDTISQTQTTPDPPLLLGYRP